ncbi:MAG: alpha amylase C-terminal domain-containing protein, partial [Ruminococcus sp.]|nr:alpha amylase C-terminal domain-containing protein [Ruminococcus sp.]
IAEESTAWPMVTKPVSDGGLGFNFKWNMGWMNDMLKYMSYDPIDRAFHHDMLTFSFFYAFSENFVLSISHDEVVHGKASLVNKMYGGDVDKKFEQCKLFNAYMMAHPGKKLMFMGTEFAQFREWDYENGLEWFLVDEYENHRNYHAFSKRLNRFYLDHPQFWQKDFDWSGFSWIANDDFRQSIIIFRRFDAEANEVIVLCNFVPVERKSYCFGVPYKGKYTEVFNSASPDGAPMTNGTVKSQDVPMHGFEQSVCIDIPPFACLYFEVKKDDEKKKSAVKKAEHNSDKKKSAKENYQAYSCPAIITAGRYQ